MLVHTFVFRSITGSNMPLERWSGQPILIVNTASECGYTPQYSKLQTLWEEYMPGGLVVIGIPCNDFGGQEPANDSEILEFCTGRYDVSFPVTTKQTITGRGAHPLFIALREEFTSDILPRWNFYKYLFGRDGQLVQHWPSDVEPDDLLFKREIERNMSSWHL
jgi:glutathione peroxidase